MTTWKYTKDGVEHGPVRTHTLRRLAQTGELRPDDLVQEVGPQAVSPVPAEKVQRHFPGVVPHNMADCPKCGAAVAFRPPVRSKDQLKADFGPWYKEKFGWSLDLGSPQTVLAQIGLWWAGCAWAWVPPWFLRDTKPVYTQVLVKCPKCEHEFDALADGVNLRAVPFDWSKVGNAAAMGVGGVVFGLYAAWKVVSFVVVVLGVGVKVAEAVKTGASTDSGYDPDRPYNPATNGLLNGGGKSEARAERRGAAQPTQRSHQGRKKVVAVSGATIVEHHPDSIRYFPTCSRCGFRPTPTIPDSLPVSDAARYTKTFFCTRCPGDVRIKFAVVDDQT